MKRALITGADGFIGSHLTELLLIKGYKVKALSQYNSFNNWMNTLQFVSQVPSHMIFDNGYCVCDEVIRCENIVNDMLTILNMDASKYGTEHENKTESRNVTYQQVHDSETKKLVQSYCFNEITEFGYEY